METKAKVKKIKSIIGIAQSEGQRKTAADGRNVNYFVLHAIMGGGIAQGPGKRERELGRETLLMINDKGEK